MEAVVAVHDSQFDVPVGNIFDIWELVEPLVERIHRDDGAEWSFTVTLGAGTRSVTVVLDPIEVLLESEADRTQVYYRTPRATDRFLCVSCVRGIIAVIVITLDDMLLDLDDVPAEFLQG